VGFDITVVALDNALIAGAGGDGGEAGFLSAGDPGVVGGTAIFTRVAIDLDLSAGGEVKGGGGGGAGGAGGFLTSGGGGGGGAGRVPGDGGLSDVGQEGQPGTLSAGGDGGPIENANTGEVPGGRGGGPGLPGQSTSSGFGTTSGGASGNAIDGVSLVTITLGSGAIVGPQIN
jgi:hypothetical protein